MCEDGDQRMVKVWIPPNLSHTGEGRWAEKPIDICIADMVEALTEKGVLTVASCCGHGISPGQIVLADGRVLTIWSVNGGGKGGT